MAPTPGKPGSGSPFGKPGNENDFELVMPDEGEGLRIPKGKYIGKLIDLIKDTAKSSGNPMLVFTFVITEGPHQGRDFKIFAALTPAAMWKVGETLRALGFQQEPGEKLKFNKKDVIGVGVMMVMEDDSYNGRDTSRLVAVEPHPKGAGFKVRGGVPTVAPAPTPEDAGEENGGVVDEGTDGGAGDDDGIQIYESEGKYYLDEECTIECDDEGNPIAPKPKPKAVAKAPAKVGGKARAKI